MRRCALFVSATLSVLVSIGTNGPAHAGAVTGGATEWTQILNNLQLVDIAGTNIEQVSQNAQQIAHQITQIENQLDQYRAMLQNLERLPDNIWGDAVADLSRLQQLVQQGQGIAFSMGELDDVLRDRFGSYAAFQANWPQDLSALYGSWSQTNHDTIAGTLAGANLTAQHFQTEADTMAQLQRQSASAVGQMQALQVGHSIASQQVEQMQKLRGLLSQQTTMMGTWYRSEQAAADLARLRYEDFFSAGSPPSTDGRPMEIRRP